MDSGKFSFKARLESFRFAFRGLWLLLKNEHNSRIHLLAMIIAAGLGIFLKISPSEWSLLIIVIGIVFLTELLNSSLETLSDFVNPERNDQIRKAKDYAAAAVLISAIIALVTGGLIFIPKIFV
ncbi:MAG: diacylglycerol kinase family protein [Bacteroidetes bacterium]|nr:MAG: diacylglycerol kinase family protein [Bacteroidota bacterium]